MKKKILLPLIVAAILWFAMFSPWTAPHLNFWYCMGCSAVVLCTLSAWLSDHFGRQFRFNYKDIGLGVASAVVLWIAFFFGDVISKWMFDFAAPQVNDIYRIKDERHLLFIAFVLVCLIGPAEEIFWRDYIQRNLTERYGKYIAYISTALIYALVHVWSFNFMLIMAALVCGLFWGLLYMYRRNLVTNIISHCLWDVSVFILFPIGQ
jgi:membrane protease YdiL (CAAX protease family)